ncbi:tRNA-modifying protein YgfZ [Cellvibrio zantedeschiae]|uniref:tRNA-modifying protein YgfZ n=1 Tax=Cellvibrio zantedeschiae TaxID=1237077 RepID=A0ABQ3B0H0_9GAMM|nr:folate-binding protein YgfZ [Cellvibrio zantedeschiae]GGY73737.1 tRNA-modifying protein YgfZ [Cellvibrio zantedeschiae]
MSNWNPFLISKGAIETSDGRVDFPIAEISSEKTYLMPLTQGLIEIKGPDSAKFLQGQVTCDVRELAEKTTRLGAQCNIKGRMLLCFRALQSDSERILLRIHAGLVANGLASLGKYIVFSKAKLADISPSYRYLGISGPQAAQIVKDVFAVELIKDDDWQAAGEHLIIRITENRYECWLAAQDAENLWNQMSAKATPAGQNLWDLLNIQAGIGDITPETFEAFTPQAINFQLVNGINFRKGCYTGQEIVARLHYRGTLKRHMYRFGFTGAQQIPAPGSELINADGKTVGEVILAAYTGSSSGELLASVVDDERVAIYLANNPQKLSLLALPYAIPTPNEAD